MADPDGARTPEEFTQALRQLVSETGKSHEDIANKAGLTGNTVRGITAGKNWPQQRTLEQLVRACGQDPRPWVNAWSPLSDARPRAERGNAKNLQEQIDALGAEMDRLHSQVRSLQDSLKQGETGDRRRERRMTDAYFDFLAQDADPRLPAGRVRVGRSGDDGPLAPAHLLGARLRGHRRELLPRQSERACHRGGASPDGPLSGHQPVIPSDQHRPCL
ncbi:helix-turn-helix domain-containing protein [Streptomyces mirabilis]|uniref:helix-turn-helix domain-containing protein n=1 Tax=Streptomyces mirabilis TaxID=68239 RepID=UPI0035DB671A